MWNYLGPIDPDRASLEELAKDEVWSWLNWVLQLRAQESLEGKPRPFHAVKLSTLVRSPLLIPCFSLLLFCILTSSHLLHRDLPVTNPGHIFRGG